MGLSGYTVCWETGNNMDDDWVLIFKFMAFFVLLGVFSSLSIFLKSSFLLHLFSPTTYYLFYLRNLLRDVVVVVSLIIFLLCFVALLVIDFHVDWISKLVVLMNRIHCFFILSIVI